MKKLLIICIAISFTFFTSCQDGSAKKINNSNNSASPEKSTTAEGPIMTFDNISHDFGTINEGDKVTTKFSFTNTGNADLIIVDARGSCGCTVPEYPRDTPIRPGESSVIKVKFDSSNKPGMQRKTVTLVTNTSKGKEMLNIKAFVLPKNN